MEEREENSAGYCVGCDQPLLYGPDGSVYCPGGCTRY